MWPYWVFFILPAVLAVKEPTRAWAQSPPRTYLALGAPWAIVALTTSLLVGLRDEVGGDWNNYLELTLELAASPLTEAISNIEPGYGALAWFAGRTDWLPLVNLICGCIFSIGLIAFCRSQPRPWLALAVAVPYLVIVVGMGYTRQGVALSLCMLGLISLTRKRSLAFVLWIASAALFHRSAVALLPLGVLVAPRGKLLNVVFILAACALMYQFVIRDSIDAFTTNYIEAEYQSEGALIRTLMNVLPAVLLVLHRRKLAWTPAERRLWIAIASLALGSSVWLALSPSSTAVDRVGLYLIPLQLYVFSRLPDLWGRTGTEKRLVVTGVVVYYAAVLFVWLIFATHSAFWIPYKFLPLSSQP